MGSGLSKKREISLFTYIIMIAMVLGMALAPVVVAYVFTHQYGGGNGIEVHGKLFTMIDKSYLYFVGITVVGSIYLFVKELRYRLKK